MSIEKPNDPLISLLAELPKVQDRGFTERVSYRVRLRELRQRVALFTAWCCALVGAVLSLPFERLFAPLAKTLQNSNTAWSDMTTVKQLTQTLDGVLQTGNFNIVIALSAGAVLLLLTIALLVRD